MHYKNSNEELNSIKTHNIILSIIILCLIIITFVSLIILFGKQLIEEKNNYFINNVQVTKETFCYIQKHIDYPTNMEIIINLNKTKNLNMTWIEITEEAFDTIDPFKECDFKLIW